MISLYQLKPQFQSLLRPFAGFLARTGITANAVTLLTTLLSCGLGVLLWTTDNTSLFILLPVWMLLRMILNATDGMLARDFGQKTPLGAYLNELTDVISDTALYLPFVAIAPLGWPSIGTLILLSCLSEYAGALGPMIGAPRGYDGPMGKSDRALLFGVLGLWVGLRSSLPDWSLWLILATSALIALNIVNRIRSGLAHVSQNSK